MTLPHEPTAIVRDALADLRPFGINDRYTAATFLAAWRRRAELTSADLRSALDHFPDPPTDRGVQLRDEMAARHDPGRLPTLSGYNPNRPRLAYPLAEAPIFGTVAEEFGPMYAEAPDALRAEFPDELGDDLDSAGPELAGFLARADTDGRMRVADGYGPQTLARLAVDRGYAKGLYHGGTVYQLQLTDAGREFAGGAQ